LAGVWIHFHFKNIYRSLLLCILYNVHIVLRVFRLKPFTIYFDLFVCCAARKKEKEKVHFYRILFDDEYTASLLNGRGKLRQIFPSSRSILDCKTRFSRTTIAILFERCSDVSVLLGELTFNSIQHTVNSYIRDVNTL